MTLDRRKFAVRWLARGTYWLVGWCAMTAVLAMFEPWPHSGHWNWEMTFWPALFLAITGERLMHAGRMGRRL